MSDKKDLCSAIYNAFKSRKQKRLRKLNDKILKKAVLANTKDFFHLAVYSYVLSKILTKPRYMEPQFSDWIESIELELLNMIENADASSRKWNSSFRLLEKAIASLEKGDLRYLTSLIRKGKLKSAAILYAQGLSLGLASKITNIEKQEILNYAGRTMMSDRMNGGIDILKRLNFARALVGD